MERPSRRDLGIAATALGAALAAPGHASNLSTFITNLRVQGQINPLGIDDKEVRLSWEVKSSAPNFVQTAYRISAATSPEKLRVAPDLWDSGKIASTDTFDIKYRGLGQRSRSLVFWRVEIWDRDGKVSSSEPASWEYGLTEPSDWTAKWVAAEDETSRLDRLAGLLWKGGPRTAGFGPRYFRLKFDVPETGKATIISVAGNDYDLYIDGNKLAPPHRPFGGFGREGAIETPVDLTVGSHLLCAEVQDSDDWFSSFHPEVSIGVLIRTGDTRITSVGMRTSTVKESSWIRPDYDDSGWEVAKAAAYQSNALPGRGAYLLRRVFSLEKTVRTARLYVTALGGYQAWINGENVSKDLLTPESTDFSRHVLYRTYDVTQQLSQGDNVLGTTIADGWYGSYQAPSGRFGFGPPPLRVLAQLEIVFSDGERKIVSTDEDWQIRKSPITSSEIYNGETYDARLEVPNWASPNGSADGWMPAGLAPVPPASLKAQSAPPIRRTQTLRPLASRDMSPSVTVHDFGQNFAGWVRFKVKGKRGDSVTLSFAEILKPDGNIDMSNLRAALATDTYIMKGDPDGEIFEPNFTYHGFRYVQIKGQGVSNVTGIVVHSDLAETGHLRIGNPVIQKLWQNTLWSQRSNFMGIPTDCPQRDERLGWMGDAGVFWDAAAFNMDVAAFTRRFMGDVRDAQAPNGAFPDFAPDNWSDAWGQGQPSPGWADAGVILPWTVWRRYGDTSIIDQNWDAMNRYMACISKSNPDGIWRNQRGRDYGDWLALDAKEPGDPTTPKDLVATAMWKASTDKMVEMAEASGRKADAASYLASGSRISKAFVDAFVRNDGSVGNGSQTGYILALKHGLVPANLRDKAAANLVADIKRRGMLLSTGFLGTPASLDVLADAGYADIVYSLLLRTSFPSWGYMVAKGATTIWERWNGDTGDVSMNSFNHYSLGAVTGFVFRRLAGIDAITPGFRTFRFKPVLDHRVTTGGGDYDSMVGRISTEWSLNRKAFELSITVPANSSAEIWMPGSEVLGLEKGKRINQISGFSVFEVGSGTYHLKSVPGVLT